MRQVVINGQDSHQLANCTQVRDAYFVSSDEFRFFEPLLHPLNALYELPLVQVDLRLREYLSEERSQVCLVRPVVAAESQVRVVPVEVLVDERPPLRVLRVPVVRQLPRLAQVSHDRVALSELKLAF